MRFDASASPAEAVGQSVITFSHTCTTKNNRALFVACTTTNGSDNFSSITYAGVSMTQISTTQSPGSGQNYLFFLLNPATGSNIVVINFSGATNIYAASASYYDVVQSGQPDASGASATDPATSITQSVNLVKNSCWIVAGCGQKSTGTSTITAGTGLTARAINDHVAIGDSNGPLNSGSHSVTWNISPSTGIDIIAASIKSIINASLLTSDI